MDLVQDTRETARVSHRDQVQSVARAVELLNRVGEVGSAGLGVTEIASALKVSKSTALTLARTLVAYGLLRPTDPGPRYVLGLDLLRFADLARQQISIYELGLPVLRDLSAITGLTSRLAINQEGFPVFLERIDGKGAVRFHAPLGQRENPHSTAAGKAILAELSADEVRVVIQKAGMVQHTTKTLCSLDALLHDLAKIRSRGFSLDDEEGAEGVVCIGAPFFDHKGVCSGALSITGLKADFPPREVPRLGAVVIDHANRLTTLLGGALPRKEQ